ncbi:hypothetical protein [Pelotalea chapellei]|uniref:ATP synthase F0 subunit 8 n=1 Tax=Pelotalea chapellei TaxID=44671 RepID=A0ABS5U3E0_9BACT|nr:hypothetical protein [Pelotalea chapellei]MBT1070190.1 hypothetical protein [Pelotalea chapellei]
MPPLIEVLLIIFTMLGAFFLVFVFMYLLALFLSPIERSLSRMIWNMNTSAATTPQVPKGSFKDFSRKHVHR